VKTKEQRIFTFGREHEITCAIRHVGDRDKAKHLIHVIELVHEMIEGSENITELQTAIVLAFTEGGAGVWESTGSWLNKLSKHNNVYHEVWLTLSSHSSHEIRFRVACFLDSIPGEIAESVHQNLLTDRSKKVREQAIGKWEFRSQN